MPLYYCERCGRHFTPAGTIIRRSITARGEFQDPEDSVCPTCLKHNELRINADVIVDGGTDEERRYTN